MESVTGADREVNPQSQDVIGDEFALWRDEQVAKLSEIYECLSPGDALQGLRDLRRLHVRWVVRIINGQRPEGAPAVTPPAQPSEVFVDTDAWSRDGWTIERCYAGKRGGIIRWRSPGGDLFELRDGVRRYLSAEKAESLGEITQAGYSHGWPDLGKADGRDRLSQKS